MRKTNFALALLTAAALAACGGNGSTGGDQTFKTKFSAQVTFGDSLADVGSYAVGTVAALGGGKWTINGTSSTNAALTGKNWTELTAAQFGLPVPCAAQTGLQGDASKGFSVPVANHAGCYGYAMGGSRVTNPVGPGNALTGSPLGALTVPIAGQIANHLAAVGGKFKGDEVVMVMGGNNDLLVQLDQLKAGATAAGQAAGASAGGQAFAASLTTQLAAGATDPIAASQAIGAAIQTAAAQGGDSQAIVTAGVTAAAQQPGNAAVADPAVYGPMVTKAQADAAAAGASAGAQAGQAYFAANAPAAVTAVGTAGAQLAALVKTQIVGNGANYVVVNTLPDLTISPAARAQTTAVQDLIKTMVNTFNDQLKAGLAGESKVLLVDLYTVSHDQAVHPEVYGLTNVTTPACAPNALGTTSLICTVSNTITGDVSHYMFADDTGHATPFEYSLIARYVTEQMMIKGWL